MMNKTTTRHFWFLSFWLVCALVLSACDDTLNRIGERPEASTTPEFQRTATPGGVISVWMVSPTGAPNDPNATPLDGTPRGEVVGPAATATALSATLIAATATAGAPVVAPDFLDAQCPVPSGRVPEPRPDDFGEFAAAVGAYLSDGGQPTVLESELRVWGAITRQGGIVQGDTDLTGDGIHEIIVTLYNPFVYNAEAVRNAGQLLIYGCDRGDYRLLYASPFSPGLSLPVLLRVGDMNADVRAEVVYETESCNFTYCLREGYILTWNPITGTFIPLNNAPIVTVNGRIGILDVDADGILEITAVSIPNAGIEGAPRRVIEDIWDWTGRNYVLAVRD